MQGEEGHDEALQPTVGNYKESHMQKPGRIKPIRTRPPRKPQRIGVSQEQELTAISSEKPPQPQEQVQKAVPLRLRAPLPPSRPGFEARTAAFNSRRREREREREMWTIREEDETRLRGRAREDQEGRKN